MAPQVTPAEQFVLPAGFLVQPAIPPEPMPPDISPLPPVNPPAANMPVPTDPSGTFNTQPATPSATPSPSDSNPAPNNPAGTSAYAVRSSIARKVTIPPSFWDALPKNCLDRMLEFDSLRTEYSATFPKATLDTGSLRDVPRFTLANLMELAMINSREYQTRKEVLYRSALLVTRQRYQFYLNPTPFNNGSGAFFRHSRDAGTTVNRLTVPSTVGFQQTLCTGGELLTRFANSVVLTFNGPSGFAADVSSEMVFDFQQTVFQRDIRFENLTQAERDVVYALRDYLRFRKQLFRDIANQYYNLLLAYRTIEINSQDYFTNSRGFLQSQSEYRTAEKIPRIQVDQFEQNVLRTRSNIITNCFALEAALDLLKIRLGLPTEMPINIDLTELASISMKDELSVARQMISRTRTELQTAKDSPVSDITSLANVAEVLTDRMLNILTIQQKIQEDERIREGNAAATTPPGEDPLQLAKDDLESLQQLLQILGARMQVDVLRLELETQLNADLPVPPLRILIRAIEFASVEMNIIDMALENKQLLAAQPERLRQLSQERDRLEMQLQMLVMFLEKISTQAAVDVAAGTGDDFVQIPMRMAESVELVKAIDQLTQQATRDILPADGTSVQQKVQDAVNLALEISDLLLRKGPDGWTDIEIDPNEALLTALVQRLDLKNQRGDLADAWRQIKLAGDDLRSIVDLRASHVLGTDSLADDPFDFTFDDSETRVSVALDTPLNRRLQRNNYRVALINYNVGIRNLIAAEDGIKLDVREDLRQLALDRNQYAISVASAALAYERVISTRIRLQLAVQNVAARDFLESQQAYTNALNSTARQHVNYITDRLELFFDLEAFDVDPLGYWDGVHEDYGPAVNVNFPGANARPYDCLPPRVWYSPTIRSMESIPPGQAIIAQPPTGVGQP
jgi:hypothetical protein